MGIEVQNLSKTYRRHHTIINAVNDISFSVQTGSITGFIGANGAGKSTTIKMMTGILTPDAGTISIDGMTFGKNRKDIMRRIGVVFGQRSVLCWEASWLMVGMRGKALSAVTFNRGARRSSMCLNPPIRDMTRRGIFSQRVCGRICADIVEVCSEIFK